jgi:hypothetical protein
MVEGSKDGILLLIIYFSSDVRDVVYSLRDIRGGWIVRGELGETLPVHGAFRTVLE